MLQGIKIIYNSRFYCCLGAGNFPNVHRQCDCPNIVVPINEAYISGRPSPSQSSHRLIIDKKLSIYIRCDTLPAANVITIRVGIFYLASEHTLCKWAVYVERTQINRNRAIDRRRQFTLNVFVQLTNSYLDLPSTTIYIKIIGIHFTGVQLKRIC